MIRKDFLNKIAVCFCSALILLLFSACGSHVYSGDDDSLPVTGSDSKFELADDIFSESPENEGLCTFDTNNKSYLNSKGCTLWALKNKNSGQTAFKSRSVRVVKESGSASAGFGIVFCVQGAEAAGTFNMFTVLLNTKGQYAVGKILKGNYTNIQWWKDCMYLNRGFGAVNYIRVDYNPESTEFTLFLNDAEAFRFSDTKSSPRLSYGGDGYVVVLDGKENFSVANTKVTFCEKKD